ncbi:MAG: hypothetical protein ABIS23_02205 [Sphingomicrobium sp.]
MVLGLLLLASAQGASVPGNPRFDSQCVIAAQSAHDQAEGELRAATLLSVMFYFGRVDSLLSGLELEQQLDEEGRRLEGQPLGPLLSQCGEFMQGRGAAMQEIGKRLQTKEQTRSID